MKVRFHSGRQRVERFGGGKYIVYLLAGEHEDFMNALRIVLSKYLGVPPGRISFQGKNYQNDLVFEVT